MKPPSLLITPDWSNGLVSTARGLFFPGMILASAVFTGIQSVMCRFDPSKSRPCYHCQPDRCFFIKQQYLGRNLFQRAFFPIFGFLLLILM